MAVKNSEVLLPSSPKAYLHLHDVKALSLFNNPKIKVVGSGKQYGKVGFTKLVIDPDGIPALEWLSAYYKARRLDLSGHFSTLSLAYLLMGRALQNGYKSVYPICSLKDDGTSTFDYLMYDPDPRLNLKSDINIQFMKVHARTDKFFNTNRYKHVVFMKREFTVPCNAKYIACNAYGDITVHLIEPTLDYSGKYYGSSDSKLRYVTNLGQRSKLTPYVPQTIRLT